MPICGDSTTGKLGRCSSEGAAGIGRVAWVAQDGTGDYTHPVAAMNDLSTWCGVPGYTNPCVLRIAPGVFDTNQALPMRDWVTVEGSGIERPTLVWTNNDSFATGTVVPSTIPEQSHLEQISSRSASSKGW